MVGVAQLVRASGCGPEGRGFESHHSPHNERTELQSSSVLSLWGDRIVHDSNLLRVASQLVQRARGKHIKFRSHLRARIGSESHHSPLAKRSVLSLWGERIVHDSNPLRVALQLVQRARGMYIKFRRNLRARMGSESHHSPHNNQKN